MQFDSLAAILSLVVLAGAGAGVDGVNGAEGAADASEDAIGGLLAIVCSIYNKVFLLYHQ